MLKDKRRPIRTSLVLYTVVATSLLYVQATPVFTVSANNVQRKTFKAWCSSSPRQGVRYSHLLTDPVEAQGLYTSLSFMQGSPPWFEPVGIHMLRTFSLQRKAQPYSPNAIVALYTRVYTSKAVFRRVYTYSPAPGYQPRFYWTQPGKYAGTHVQEYV